MRRLDKSHTTLLHTDKAIKSKLESQLKELHRSEDRITHLSSQMLQLKLKLKSQSEDFDKEIAQKEQMKDNFESEKRKLLIEYEAKIEQSDRDGKFQFDNLTRENASKLEKMDSNYKSEIEHLNTNHSNQIEQLNKDLEYSHQQHSKDNQEVRK